MNRAYAYACFERANCTDIDILMRCANDCHFRSFFFFRAKKGQPHVTVAWYFRPEQTIHPAVRQFWEGEVFKTSRF